LYPYSICLHPIVRRFLLHFFASFSPPTPRSTLFPYTTLFRSAGHGIPATARPCAPCAAGGDDGRLPSNFAAACRTGRRHARQRRSEEHTSELQSRENLVCRLLLEKKNRYLRFFRRDSTTFGFL